MYGILGFRMSSGSGGKSFDSRDFGFGWRGAGVAGRVNDENAVDEENDGDVDTGEKAETNGGVKEDVDDEVFGGNMDGFEFVGGAGNDVVGGGG